MCVWLEGREEIILDFSGLVRLFGGEGKVRGGLKSLLS